MHEMVMQKNYAKAYKLVILLAVVLAVLSAVAVPLSLSQQIREAAALEQTYGEDRHDGEHDGQQGGHDSEDAWKSQITPLTPGHFVFFGVLGLLWVLLAAWYWLLTAAWLYRSAVNAGMNKSLWMILGLAVGVLVGNVCLKNLIARPRPCWLDDSVMMLISSPADYSFSSGHTLSSVIGATVLTKTDRRFGWAAIPLAAVIAFSRLYLFVHFPSDILAGAILGVIIVEAVYRIGMRCGRRQRTPQER